MRRCMAFLLLVLGCTDEQERETECERACGVVQDCFGFLGPGVGAYGLPGFDECPARCITGGVDARTEEDAYEPLLRCAPVAILDACNVEFAHWTCGPIRDCIQENYGIEADLRRALSIRPIAAEQASVGGQGVSCKNGECTSLLSCIDAQSDEAPSSTEETQASLVDICEGLGVGEVWFGLEPQQTIVVEDPDSAQVQTLPPEFTTSMSCADAIVRGGQLRSNGGRVVLSMYARGTMNGTDYCWLLARGSTDVRAQPFGESAFLPIRSLEELIEDAPTALPCTEPPS